jgi:hypothetical protein
VTLNKSLQLNPTRMREKPGGGLSHPVGAELISNALVGVPQFGELSIWFHREPGNSLGLFTPGWALRRLQGSSANSLLGFAECLVCSWTASSGWGLTIRPVPRAERRDFTEMISDTILPALRRWLAVTRPDTWFEGQHVFQAGVNPERDLIAFLETHNDRIVEQKRIPRARGGGFA